MILEILYVVSSQIVVTLYSIGRLVHGTDPVGTTSVILAGIDLISQGFVHCSIDTRSNGGQDLFGLKDETIRCCECNHEEALCEAHEKVILYFRGFAISNSLLFVSNCVCVCVCVRKIKHGEMEERDGKL